MVKIAQLQRFVTVAETGSINKAAEKLFISQPTLSASMKALEDEVGKPLLNRYDKGVTLTRDGEMLYQYGQTVLKEMELISELKNTSDVVHNAEISISVYSLLLKESLFAEFCKECRAKETVINVEEVALEELINNVCQGKSEMGLAVVSDLELPIIQNVAEARKMKLIVVDSGPLYAHITEASSLYSKEKITAEDLKKCTFCHLPFDTYSILRQSVAIDGVPVGDLENTLVANNYPLMVGMLNKMDAFMLGNCWQKDELQKHNVITRRLDTNMTMNLVLFTNDRKKMHTPEENIFMRLITQHYGKEA
ncbi:MAG: LysR family transcriptional regulator [Eubacteriales bacterium]|nr:LysR family transcriptional regulator [Eubacteriales bacterium]